MQYQKETQIEIDCVDVTQVNKVIKQVRHAIATLDELQYDLSGAKVFSNLDLNKGFHQLELNEDLLYYKILFNILKHYILSPTPRFDIV